LSIVIVAIVIALISTFPSVLDPDLVSRSGLEAATKPILEKTKKQLGALVERDSEEQDFRELVVSGWISDRGTVYQVNTTGDHRLNVFFPIGRTSIIGCAFTNPNRVVVRTNEEADIVVSRFNGESDGNSDGCEFELGPQRIHSIVCSSYNPTSDPEYTVGVCASTTGTQNLTSETSRVLMREMTKNFYRDVRPFLGQRLIQPSLALNRFPSARLLAARWDATIIRF